MIGVRKCHNEAIFLKQYCQQEMVDRSKNKNREKRFLSLENRVKEGHNAFCEFFSSKLQRKRAARRT